MNILVTGGAGFVGSHLIELLLKQGHKVLVIDDFSSGKVTNIPYGNKDLSVKNWDISKPMDDFKDEINNCEVIFHLSAKPLSINTDVEQAKIMYETNVTGTYNLMSILDSKIHIVFVSTANVYGSGRLFWSESPFRITSTYGYTKCIGERIVEAKTNPYTIFRPGTIVGIRGRCFPNCLVWCCVNNESVSIFRGGNVVRDIIDVRDAVHSFSRYNNFYGIYNLGGRNETTGKQLVNLVAKIGKKRGFKLKPKFIKDSPKTFIVESTLMTNPLFTPKFTLKETIKTLFDYYERGGIEPPRWESL